MSDDLDQRLIELEADIERLRERMSGGDSCCDCDDIDYIGLTSDLISYVEYLGGNSDEFNNFTSIREANSNN